VPYIQHWQNGEEYGSVCNVRGGRHSLDAVWSTQVKNLIRSQNIRAAEVLWDLKKFYEHVQHQHLAREASVQGYPAGVLKFSLHSYCWPRKLILDAAVGQDLHPGKGVVAGSSLATFEVSMLLQRELCKAAITHQVVASIHIDDLSVTAEGLTYAALQHKLGAAAKP
jgi:hypothetical protein